MINTEVIFFILEKKEYRKDFCQNETNKPQRIPQTLVFSKIIIWLGYCDSNLLMYAEY